MEDFDSDKLKMEFYGFQRNPKGSFKDLNLSKKIMNYDAKIIANKYIELYENY